MGHLGEFEQLILFAVAALGEDAYGGAIRALIEESNRPRRCVRRDQHHLRAGWRSGGW